MTSRRPLRHYARLSCVILCAAGALLARPSHAEVVDKTVEVEDTDVYYKVVLPDHYDASKPYPGVLGFGGGSQGIAAVNNVIERYFRDLAEKRGYIVIVPADPSNLLYFQGGERNIFPAFLKQLLTTYKIAGDKFHAAGPSNGGLTAFQVASMNPQYFLSITAFPGYLREDTPEHIQAIANMCINMFVGELDPLGWQRYMQKQAAVFRDSGTNAQYTVEAGQPHSMDTLAGVNAGRLFDLFAQAQHGCAKNP